MPLGHDVTLGRSGLRISAMRLFQNTSDDETMMFTEGGMTVNGFTAPVWPLSAASEAGRYRGATDAA